MCEKASRLFDFGRIDIAKPIQGTTTLKPLSWSITPTRFQQTVERVNGEAQNPEVVDAPEEDDLSKLERLAKLHESGALNDEEFAQAKKKILG